MPKETILIGSRLPFGLKIEAVDSNGQLRTAEIRGLNSSRIVGATHVTTEVPRDLAEAWASKHPDFPAIRSGAIFVAESERDAQAVAKEVQSQTTGLEPLVPGTGGVETDKG